MSKHPEEGTEEREFRVSAAAAAGGAAVTLAIPAWILDVPLETVMIVAAFFFVGYVSSVLFNRLAEKRSLPHRSKWTTTVRTFVQSVTFGGLIGVVGASGHEYFDAIGIGGAVLAGLIVSLIDAAWRQRWGERRPYRETLLLGQSAA